MAARSYLYVPADSPDRMAKAVTRGADAVVFDLEDSVPPAGKAAARKMLADHLRAVVAPTGPERWVRVNGTHLAEDIAAVVGPALTGIFVPKAEPGSLAEADELLTAAEESTGLRPGSVRIVPLIETAVGVLRAAEVAGAARVARLGMGEADLIGELRLRPGPERHELAGVRLQVVLASAAAGIEAPIGPVDTRLADPGALHESTLTLLRQGFRARTAIHPRQVAVLNEVFTPTDDEIVRARETLAALAAVTERGSGVAVDRDGRIVDLAVVRAAREVLSRVR